MTKAETISYLKAYLNGDTAVGNIIPLRSVLESAIEALSQPSLPSNLDEAAEESMPEEEGFLEIDIYGGSKAVYSREQMLAMFKAGAECMAGQGETIDGYIAGTNEVAAILAIPRKEYNKGDKVVVQIRKK